MSRKFCFVSVSLAAAALTGCGLGTSTKSAVPTAVPGVAVHGSVFGGQQPVVGATIQLYAAGTAGYGSAATALVSANVMSGAGGSFDLAPGGTPLYTCPSASAPVYITATGGNAGYTTNANIALMAALGPCGNLTQTTFVNINEITTVASVYALAPFTAGPVNAYTRIGSSAINATGLANAMADVNVLANVATGAPAAALTAPYGSTVVAGATMPVPTIDTLANIIAACVNTAGGTAGANNSCGTLFTATTVGGNAPTDTITALFNIATHPAMNVGTLDSLAAAAPPFQPTLSAQPSDFTLAANFTAGGFSTPSALASDAAGNIWITNSGANTVTQLAHAGNPLSGAGYSGAFNAPSALAFAADGTLWVTNQGNNTVSRLNATGGAVSGSPYSGGGLAQPRSIAFDVLGNAWIANAGNASVTTINSAGTSLANYTPAGATQPIAIGVNPH